MKREIIGTCETNEKGEESMKGQKLTKKKKIIYILTFLVCALMMVLIHRRQRNIIKFYDLDKREYVDINIKSSNYLRGNYTSLHTAVFGYLVDYGFVTCMDKEDNPYYHEDPKCEETTFNGLTS